MTLRVAAISDIHGYLPIIEESADILLIAGDISPLEIQFNKPKMKTWIETEFAYWIKSLPVDRVFLIAGNHDSYLESISKTNILALQQACVKLTYLKNEVCDYVDSYGQVWTIFGTPYCHIFGNWPFMRSDEYMTEKFKQIPDEVDIIISHDPPFAAGDVDVILETPQHRFERMFTHLGNDPLRDRIEKVNYKLLVCGHVHGGSHDFTEEWKSVNVSYLNEYYEPYYDPFYITLTK